MTIPVGVGDRVAEVWHPRAGAPHLGAETTVKLLTPTLIVTADDRKWSIRDRWPLAQGRNSGRILLSVHEEEVLALRARAGLRRVASRATNLEFLARNSPEEIHADLSAIVREAVDAQGQIVKMMREATLARQVRKP